MYIQVNKVSKSFKKKNVLKDITFNVKKGKIIALLGPSGSGKTTILRIIAGLEKATAGNVVIDNQDVGAIAPQDRGIGFVFQNYALFRYLTVAENIAFGLKTKGVSKEEIKAKVEWLLQLTGLDEVADSYPEQLSGGQKQRVAFARAIAPEPKVLLLDEPFAALDKQIRQELRSWLKQTIHQLGITSIFVTHDHTEAIEISDEIIVMNKGYICQSGSPNDIYTNPNCEFVASFIGNSSILESPELSEFNLPQKPYKVQIRPENVHVYKKSDFCLTTTKSEIATVKSVTFKGSTTAVELNFDGQQLIADLKSSQSPIMIGDEVAIKIDQLMVFKHGSSQLVKASRFKTVTRTFASN